MKNKIKDNLLFILMTLLIFYGFLSKYINPIFKYTDEIIVIYLFIYFLISVHNNNLKITKHEKRMIISIALLSFIGFCGNCFSFFQKSVIHIFLDWFAFMKFPFTYFFLSKILEVKYKTLNYNQYRRLLKYCKLIILVIFFIALFNAIFDWNLALGYSRFNIPSYSLGGHPSFAAAVCCAIASFFMIDYKKNGGWIIICLILCVATLRIKAIVWAILIFLMIIINRNKKINKKKLFAMLLVGFLIAFSISFKSIQFYFIDPNASRNNALMGSFKIANNYFPIGGGFATFGTVSSVLSYSNAYYYTNLAYRWGFMEEASSFIGDGGWATEIGQFGYLGAIFCLCYLIYTYLDVKNKNKNSIYSYVSIFLYILISSTSENTLGSEYIVIFGIILSIISNLKNLNSESEEVK